jgi:hypothetical protein
VRKTPLAEVFGYAPDDFSDEAVRHREGCLCPYGNRVDRCTKDKSDQPLGVCTIRSGDSGDELAITCPVRFRQGSIVAADAAEFFFGAGATWKALSEIRLHDAQGKSAGNIDAVIVSLDTSGRILDFGALEIQAVYVSGNIRNPFEHYMRDPESRWDMDWSNEANYPRPDYLSSSRKRLVPQLVRKGGILSSWGKKIAVAVHAGFFETIPVLPEASPEDADIAWLVYDLDQDRLSKRYQLMHVHTVYTEFDRALTTIATSAAGSIDRFLSVLQEKAGTLSK